MTLAMFLSLVSGMASIAFYSTSKNVLAESDRRALAIGAFLLAAVALASFAIGVSIAIFGGTP